MNLPQIILIRTVGWALILAYLHLSAIYGVTTYTDLKDPVAHNMIMCANAITDPLSLLLSYGTPFAALGVAALYWEARRRKTSHCPTCIASGVTLSLTMVLVYFGMWYFQGPLAAGAGSLSSTVWWMKPFCRVPGLFT